MTLSVFLFVPGRIANWDNIFGKKKKGDAAKQKSEGKAAAKTGADQGSTDLPEAIAQVVNLVEGLTDAQRKQLSGVLKSKNLL